MLLVLAFLPLAGSVEAAPKTKLSFRVTELVGDAHVLPRAKGEPKDGAAWKRLKKGSEVRVGDAVKTGEKSRIELTLADGSRLRLGAASKVTLSEGQLMGAERKVSITMWVGRLWAKVAKKLGDESKFEVETRNAVAGVRGTSFTVIANQDLSALVRVYSGTVGVRKNDGKSGGFRDRKRTEVAGPSRVDQKQWEEIIATQMKQVAITNLGEILPATDFEDQGEELEWAMWNQARDEAVR
jgi:ferric-dicitrate binding protein FerR (iron transport regulator)